MRWRAELREAGFKVKRTVLPGSAALWNDWTRNTPTRSTNWNAPPARRADPALAYRSGEAWSEAGYSNPRVSSEKLTQALAIADADQRRGLMVDIQRMLQESGIVIHGLLGVRCSTSTTRPSENYYQHATCELGAGRLSGSTPDGAWRTRVRSRNRLRLLAAGARRPQEAVCTSRAIVASWGGSSLISVFVRRLGMIGLGHAAA
ncbi:MAG: hypothetical protein ACN6I5_08300 [Hyphomicrobiales bacterium]